MTVETGRGSSTAVQRWLFWLVAAALVLALAGLQYRLWLAEGGLPHTAQLKERLDEQNRANEALRERNNRLRAEVSALQSGSGQLEAHAREDLGLVKQGETYFMFVDEPLQGRESKAPR